MLNLFAFPNLSINRKLDSSVFMLAKIMLFLTPVSSALKETEAAFTLNFIPDDGSYTSDRDEVNYSCHMSYISSFNCDGSRGSFDLNGSHDDGSAAFQQMFTSGGKTYYHVIIGDYTKDSFYMEYIIEANSNWGQYNGSFAVSASTGTTGSDRVYGMTNPYDSNSSLTGTGTGNPTRVIMHMVLDDGVIYNEFLKDQFDRKPLIKQTISDPSPTLGISMEYTLDMRNKTYTDSTPISENDRTNKTFLIGDTAGSQGDYDSTNSVSTPVSFIQGTDDLAAGAYTYTPGSGFGGSDGTYTYYLSDGITVDTSGFQPVDKDYSVFCIPSQNVDWSGNGACTNGDGSGGGRGGGGWGGWGGW
jgi:hypothetical protein